MKKNKFIIIISFLGIIFYTACNKSILQDKKNAADKSNKTIQPKKAHKNEEEKPPAGSDQGEEEQEENKKKMTISDYEFKKRMDWFFDNNEILYDQDDKNNDHIIKELTKIILDHQEKSRIEFQCFVADNHDILPNETKNGSGINVVDSIQSTSSFKEESEDKENICSRIRKLSNKEVRQRIEFLKNFFDDELDQGTITEENLEDLVLDLQNFSERNDFKNYVMENYQDLV